MGPHGLYLDLTNLLEIRIRLSNRSGCQKKRDEFSLEQVVLRAQKVLKQYGNKLGITTSLCLAKTFLQKITTMTTQNLQEVCTAPPVYQATWKGPIVRVATGANNQPIKENFFRTVKPKK